MLLHEIFDFHGRARGQNCFAIFNGATLSYAEARLRSIRIAVGLTALGLKRGQRIAVLSENSVDVLLVFLAASRARLVVVPLNYRQSSREWTQLLVDSESVAIISDVSFCAQVDGETALAALKRVVLEGESDGWMPVNELATSRAGARLDQNGVEPDDIIFQMYTSGTTGRPKGALISHRNIVMNIMQSTFAMPFKLNPGDRTLVVLPLFHIAAISTALGAIASGATLVIHPNVDPRRILESMEEDNIASVSLVPAVIQFLLAMPDIEKRKFPGLRSVGYGASPIAVPVLRRAMEVFACEFVQGYGMTELAGSCSLLSETDHRRALAGRPELLMSAGKVLPGFELRIVNEKDEDVVPGEVGEIVVRGEQVTVGYWKMPEATAEATRGGWFHTGDAGSMDEEGYIFIRDRIKDMIVSGAENIYPAEIEAVLYQHPDVAEAAVIGVPDERWGETVMAVIVRKPGAKADESDFDDHCREHLGGFKVPRRYQFADGLPRNASGKVLKRELRAEFWQGQERFVN